MQPVVSIGFRAMDVGECGKRIRAARAYAGIGQREMASKLGIGRNSLIAMEAGKKEIRPGTQWEISKICDVPLWFLTADWTPAEVTEKPPNGS